MVWARLVAGLLTAALVGWLWERLGRPEWMKPRLRVPTADQQTGAALFLPTVRGDFTGRRLPGDRRRGRGHAEHVEPRHFMLSIGSSVALSILVMVALAFVLALCSLMAHRNQRAVR